MALKTFFIDASFLVALLKKDDPNHKKAEEIASSLIDTDSLLYVNFIAIAEAATVLSQRVSKTVAREIIQSYENGDFVEVEVNRRVKIRAMEIFSETKSNNLPFFDAIHFSTMESVGLRDVLTFDKHFKKFGFKVNTV